MNDERLLLEWLLSAEDIEFVIDRSRGTENRLKYAIQICCLKQTGRFIDKWPAISVNILNHLSKQLEIDLVHGCLDTGNKNSESKIRQEVKLFLEFKDFDFKNDTLILNFLEQNPLLISNKNEIAKEVENSLIKAKIHLPCKNQLMRHVYRGSKRKPQIFPKLPFDNIDFLISDIVFLLTDSSFVIQS